MTMNTKTKLTKTPDAKIYATFYLSGSLCKDLRRYCDGHAMKMSPKVEMLIKEFLKGIKWEEHRPSKTKK
jgi:hypothetical protein